MKIMLRKLSPIIFGCLFSAGLFVTAVDGQDGPPANPEPGVNRPQDGRRNFADHPQDNRPNLIAQLGLSQEQIQQFRKLNAEHRPQMNEAQRRFRAANRELDIAIYADVVSEDAIQAKLKAFQEAQAEVDRLRFSNELNIRRILTPEQVVRFRDMRRRFAEMGGRQIRPNARPGMGDQHRDDPPLQRATEPPPNRSVTKENRPNN
ncbi:MAG: Spy/CpxP family protein refolding chaperone [Pyrinomonadaceae bacterium]